MPTRRSLRLTIDMPEEALRRLKALATLRGQTMQEIVLEWIQAQLYSSNTPNLETLKAIEQVERGEDLIKADSIDDLFEKLGI
ncbi:MAG: hypothetical protein ACOYKZ_04515 [Chlamydiia bacterium]